MRLGLGLGVKNSTFVGGYDSSAQAFLTATGITGKTESDAINALVINLKAYGLWSKMKAIYPIVSDTVNTFSYSEDFTNPAWVKNIVLVTGNTTIAPDGTTTADTLQNQGTGYITQSNIALSSLTYTQSVYAKKNNNDWVAIYTSDQGANYAAAWFNLNTGVKGTVTAVGNFTSASSTITSVGDGWYRCTITFTKPSSAASDSAIIVPTGDNTFSRTNGQNIYIWGAQFQQGTLTTYQPIATTPANRFVSQFKYNLKDPRDLDAAFRLAFNGTWTYSKQGALPNGVNAYADTYYLESANATLNSGHISYYSRTNIAGNPFMGASNGTTETNIYPNNGGTFYPRIQATNSGVPSVNLNAAAYFIASRINATEVNGYRNTTKYTVSNPTVSLNNLRRYYLGAGNDSTIRYNANQTAFSTIGDGLTDTEATNLYTSVQQFNQDLSRQVGVPIVSDSDAQAFLNSAQITDLTQANAINTLVIGLKNASLWTKMKAIYPFVGGTATSHKWNLKDPRDLDAAYRLAFFGAWTHSSNGALPNGVNGYANTYLNPSTVYSTNDSLSLGYYSRDIASPQSTKMGSADAGLGNGSYLIVSYSGISYNRITTSTSQVVGSIGTTPGLYALSRIASTNFKYFRNSTLIQNDSIASTGRTSNTMWIGGVNYGGSAEYGAGQTAFNYIGDGLSDSEISSMYTLVQNFQTTLNRQVP